MSRTEIEGIVFDKDGTLFDFNTTWSTWTRDLLYDLARTHGGDAHALARAIEFDLATCRFLPGSPIIAASGREGAEILSAALPGSDPGHIEQIMRETSGNAPLQPAVPLVPFLGGLSRRGLKLGVVTNDTDHGARAHLTSAGVLAQFDFIAGYDSGHGFKPAPDPLLAFARLSGLDPARCVMVGDSTHDLRAGRAAGMWCLGVLTGLAEHAELSPMADAVLPDIGHIPGWLDA